MILTFFINNHDLQQGLSGSKVCKIMHLPLASLCVRITIYDHSSGLHGSISTGIYIQFDSIMERHLHLSLDFNEIFPHSTSPIVRQNDSISQKVRGPHVRVCSTRVFTPTSRRKKDSYYIGHNRIQ